MKSAYELAMERLQKNAPSVVLTEEQKAEIAEIESATLAKIAEKELFLQGEMAKERARGNFAEMDSLQKELAHEVARLRETAETKKERVRQGTAA
ncbi:MAG TPA: hypothetical protein VF585_05685 [Chthoniobacterales bacterium]|jgi:hypothetical protein